MAKLLNFQFCVSLDFDKAFNDSFKQLKLKNQFRCISNYVNLPILGHVTKSNSGSLEWGIITSSLTAAIDADTVLSDFLSLKHSEIHIIYILSTYGVLYYEQVTQGRIYHQKLCHLMTLCFPKMVSRSVIQLILPSLQI